MHVENLLRKLQEVAAMTRDDLILLCREFYPTASYLNNDRLLAYAKHCLEELAGSTAELTEQEKQRLVLLPLLNRVVG